MNNLIRERKGMLILSLLVILLPMGLGLFLWNQLPDQVPIHFGLNGQADNYAGQGLLLSLGCLCLWRRSRCCCWW